MCRKNIYDDERTQNQTQENKLLVCSQCIKIARQELRHVHEKRQKQI